MHRRQLMKKMMMMGGIPWYLKGGIERANCLAAFQPKGAASYASSKINLITPGVNDAIDGAAFPTWDSTGWTFADASSQYLTVGVTPLVTVNPLFMICGFIAGQTNKNCHMMGVCDTVGNSRQVLWIAATALVNYISDSANAGTSTLYSAGSLFVAAGVSIANNSRAVYLNGGGKGTGIDITVPASLDTNFIGCSSWGGALTGYYNGKITACAFYNIAPSDAQVLSLSTAMLAL